MLLGSNAWAQVTQRVSVATGGTQGNSDSGEYAAPSISSDGRFVAFSSHSSNLVAGDTNGFSDIFVRDRLLGTTEVVSVNAAGRQGNWESLGQMITPDGRFVTYFSVSSNLVPGDLNGTWDVFVRDRLLGSTEVASVDAAGQPGDLDSWEPSISADGRYVAFFSHATNLVPGDTNGETDIFVRDRLTGTTERVSVDSSGAQATGGDSVGCSISADGRCVAFTSAATNLVPGDMNGFGDIFVRDRLIGTTELVNVSPSGGQANNYIARPLSISADGRYVAFSSLASNLAPGDTNNLFDVFVRDRQSGTTERVDVGPGGAQGYGHNSGIGSVTAISGDGRYVAFGSDSTNLVPGDTNGVADSFLRDRQSGTTIRVSLASSGAQGNDGSGAPSVSVDGRYVAFVSSATNLVPADTNGVYEVFVRDRDGGPDFTSLCDAGVGGVLACPCANAPGGPGQGCDNSSGTGGAILSASGGTFLSSDSLVFTTSGERPTALSIVTQWTGSNPAGTSFGQGVRCTSGALKRLYTKSAVGGGITAPDFGVGEIQVSVRSAALGDVIVAGQSRWHFVYYRDPIVLGGCPSTSTFNATQTGQVMWSP
jgi:Tol biopolymer transport system component